MLRRELGKESYSKLPKKFHGRNLTKAVERPHNKRFQMKKLKTLEDGKAPMFID